jgi:lambda repressor-like predicted transcriptional regulator
MSDEKHPVPAGIAALNKRGFSAAALGRILGLAGHVGAAKKLRGVSCFTVRDLMIIADALNVQPAALFDPRLADLQLKPEHVDARLKEARRPVRAPGATRAAGKSAKYTPPPDNPLQVQLFTAAKT